MKVALLGDLHIGIKQDDQWTVKNQLAFFDHYFKVCKEKGVTATIQTGDWFDVRRGISQEALQMIREELIPRFQEIGHTYVDVGNHDMHKREVITPNSCREVLGHYEDFTIIEKPETFTFDDVKIDIIPWICKENQTDIMKFIKKSKSSFCLGHFELSGFYYYTGIKSDGTDSNFLKDYKHVWSGHFHTQSQSGNVQYIGTPYTLTLGDANDSRGFYIFDTETLESEYIENPDCWHKKLYFDADTFKLDQLKSLKNCAVRVIVEKRASDIRKIDFDVIMERLSNACHSLDILDNLDFIDEDGDVVIEIEDTQKFVDEYIDSLTEHSDVKTRCKIIFAALQREAIDLE